MHYQPAGAPVFSAHLRELFAAHLASPPKGRGRRAVPKPRVVSNVAKVTCCECWAGMIPGEVREEDCCGICGREADSLNHLSPEAAKVAGADMICEDCTERTFGYYRIVGPLDGEEQLYWSNADGWVDRESANLFRGPVNLPMGCTDLEYTEDPDEVAPCLVCGEPKPNREACPTCQEAEKEAQA